MAERPVCADCGRPHAIDGCDTCGRSRNAPWPVSHVGIGVGKGGPGALRGKSAGRRYMISVRFSEDETARLKAAAAEAGVAVGRLVRELVADGFAYRERPNSFEEEERRRRLKALSVPGNEPQRPAEKLRPVNAYGIHDPQDPDR